MICVNCGAEYDKRKLACPYCHSENKIVAEQKKKQILYGYDKEADTMKKTLPKKTINKWTKRTLIFSGIFVSILFVICLIVYISGQINAQKEYDKREDNVKMLEEYFTVKDFKALSLYMEEQDLSAFSFPKYDEIKKIYDSLIKIQERYAEIADIIEDDSYEEDMKLSLCGYQISSMISNGCNILTYCDEWVKDAKYMGNEECLVEMKENAISIFTDIGFSRQEAIDLMTEENKEASVEKLSDKLFQK